MHTEGSAQKASNIAQQSIQEVAVDNEESYVTNCHHWATTAEGGYHYAEPDLGMTARQKLEEYHKYVAASKMYQYAPYYHPDKLEVDLRDLRDVQHPIDYALPCQHSMLRSMHRDGDGSFATTRATEQCLALQQEINVRMRRILIEWLVDVHLKFRLLPETLFLCVSLMDRFCKGKLVQKKNYQLLGVTCMLIAGKYEEIYPPRIMDYVEITDRAYSKDDVRKMEVMVLSEVHFELTLTSTFRFLERYTRLAQSTAVQKSVAQYAIELSLVEVSMNRYMPDTIACAAIYVSRKLTARMEMPWSTFMIQ